MNITATLSAFTLIYVANLNLCHIKILALRDICPHNITNTQTHAEVLSEPTACCFLIKLQHWDFIYHSCDRDQLPAAVISCQKVIFFL